MATGGGLSSVSQSGFSPESSVGSTASCHRIIKPFARHLPSMRAVFSIHDQPQVYVSWARRSSLVDLGLRGER